MSELSRRDFFNVASIGVSAALFGRHLDFGEKKISPSLTDVLNASTQNLLLQKADSLISMTPLAAIKTSDDLRQSTKSSAAGICGPVAFYPIHHSVTYGVPVKEFWRVAPGDPSTPVHLFDEAFPGNRFDKYDVKSPVLDFDFGLINLQPGDFLFLRAENTKDSGANHMVTISRRDKNGMLYSVTNYPDASGKYIIEEVPFWNPNDPESSWIRGLARGQNSIGFSSGKGGFWLCRLKDFQTSYYDISENGADATDLQSQIDTLTRNSTGDWRVMIKNLSTDRIVAETGCRMRTFVASCFKVPLSMAILKGLEDTAKSESDFKNNLITAGFQGRTFDQLLKAMLVESKEDAADMLTNYLIAKKVDRDVTVSSWGAEETSVSFKTSTEDDMCMFFDKIYHTGFFRFPSTNGYLLKLLSESGAPDQEGFGLLRKLGVKVGNIYYKRGSAVTNETLTIADMGVVEILGADGTKVPYFVGLIGNPRPTVFTNETILENELTSFVAAFADYLKAKG